MTNTTESIAPVNCPGAPDHRASSAAFKEYAEIVGRLICAARPMTIVNQANKPELVVSGRSWPAHADKAFGCQAALDEGNVDLFLELLGVPSAVRLSQDGRPFDTDRWCRCPGERTADEWVYAEVWTVLGMVSHGWVHSVCRTWLQTG